MAAVDKSAGELYLAFNGLAPPARRQFLSMLQPLLKQQRPEPPEREVTLLYQRISDKLYTYRGIKLPPLHSPAIGKSALVEELRAALRWLSNGTQVDRPTLAGLIEMAAEAVTREVAWNYRQQSITEFITALSCIPAAVDRAFPGYHMNGILTLVAKSMGEGRLVGSTDTDE